MMRPTGTSALQGGVDVRYTDIPQTVAADELMFAITSAYAAATGRTPRRSMRADYEDALDTGRINPDATHIVLNDHPMNHAGFAIIKAFPEASQGKCMALMHRVLFVLPALLTDERSHPFHKRDDQGTMISPLLIEAVALTPMRVGQAIPVDSIFDRVAKLTAAAGIRQAIFKAERAGELQAP